MDMSPWELAKNWPATLAMVADPQMGLRDLLALLPEKLSPAARRAAEARLQAAGEQRARVDESLESLAKPNRDAVPIAVPCLMKVLADCLEPGHHRLRRSRSPTRPTFPATSSSTSRGTTSVPSAADWAPACRAPWASSSRDRRAGWSASSATALPCIPSRPCGRRPTTASPSLIVICNNASYRILKINMLHYLGEAAARRRFIAMDLTNPLLDFARIAEAFGVRGQRVEHPDELAPALRAALSRRRALAGGRGGGGSDGRDMRSHP